MNQLVAETSPYLLQHKDNPVDRHVWSQETLNKAKTENKPILLSIGYAACHWCHVMARESFENAETAALVNNLFIPIKVDREERPEIDQIYMAALSSMGEQGGWPLTMFLTPEGKPFWGGTYFPGEPRYGRPGFVQVLDSVAKVCREKRDSINQSADGLTAHVAARLSAAEASTWKPRGPPGRPVPPWKACPSRSRTCSTSPGTSRARVPGSARTRPPPRATPIRCNAWRARAPC